MHTHPSCTLQVQDTLVGHSLQVVIHDVLRLAAGNITIGFASHHPGTLHTFVWSKNSVCFHYEGFAFQINIDLSMTITSQTASEKTSIAIKSPKTICLKSKHMLPKEIFKRPRPA